MINFYNYIHATLREAESDELIFWPQPDSETTEGLSNKALHERISNYRELLKGRVQPGHTVLLAIPASIQAISALLAVQSMGAIPVLPPAKPDLRTLLSVIRKQKIRIVLIEKKSSFIIRTALKFLGAKCLYPTAQLTAADQCWEPAQVPPYQAALISYSSGTTGKPKGIYRSHRVLSAQHLLIKKLFPAEKKHRDFPLFPNVILHNLASGLTSILPAIPGFQVNRLNPADVITQLEKLNVQRLTGNVFYFRKLLNHLNEPARNFPTVKLVGIGGSPVPEDLVPALRPLFPNADFYIIYGSSEAEPIAIRQVNGTVEDPLKGFAVGSPCEDLDFRITATTAIQTPEGAFVAGQIEVRGSHVAAKRNDGWLNTGDIGYLDHQKRLYLTARIGNETAHKGIQHFQIEHLLILQPGIDQAAAISTDHGFHVFIQGPIQEKKVWEILKANFPAGLIVSIAFKNQIPVDQRHQSKVLYHKLK